MKVVLTTDRVRLRQLTEADADNLLALDTDPDVLRYLPVQPHPTSEGYLTDIRSRFWPYYDKHEKLGVWAIEEKHTGTFLGCFCLRLALDDAAAVELQYQPGDLELGYRLRRSTWGQGYATEIVRAVVRWAFTELGALGVVALTAAENLPSIRVLEKAGLRQVDRLYRLAEVAQPFLKYTLSQAEYNAQGNHFSR